MSFAESVNTFNTHLELDTPMPEEIEVMNPFRNPETRIISERFYNKYYDDSNKRIFLFGINPGRFGAGLTGVCFADPVKLEKYCDIPNHLPKKAELSSDFVFEVIMAYGGPNAFYSRFFITAVCPLGFVRHGKNLNYYDSKELTRQVEPFIVESTWKQIAFGASRELSFCIGEGENYKYFNKLNKEHGFFEEIVPLPHPRFILQYRRKRLQEFVEVYLKALEGGLKHL